MVTDTVIVSRHKEGFPPRGKGWNSRKISGGPLYSPDEVCELILAKKGKALVQWTKKCTNNMMDLSLDLDDASELVALAVKFGRYKDSEWCQNRFGGPWAACDSYVIRQRERGEYSHNELDVDYYIKFAIADTGAILLLISCHV